MFRAGRAWVFSHGGGLQQMNQANRCALGLVPATNAQAAATEKQPRDNETLL